MLHKARYFTVPCWQGQAVPPQKPVAFGHIWRLRGPPIPVRHGRRAGPMKSSVPSLNTSASTGTDEPFNTCAQLAHELSVPLDHVRNWRQSRCVWKPGIGTEQDHGDFVIHGI